MVDTLHAGNGLRKHGHATALPATILVVEDEQDQRTFITHLLTDGGYRVVTASGGEDGVCKVKTQKFDLVVTDLAMPNVSGVQVIAAIKSDPDIRRIPVLVVTAYTWNELGRAALDAGADAYISKPLTRTRLLHEVAKHLNPAPAKGRVAVGRTAKGQPRPLDVGRPYASVASIASHQLTVGRRGQS